MSIYSENLLNQVQTRKKLVLWRNIAILAIISSLLILVFRLGDFQAKSHIAEVKIENIITEDDYRDQVIRKLSEDKNVKAVFLKINSPGGTIVGGENLYYSLKQLSKDKPVIALMGSLATSGGYMAALAANRIYAKNGTITGSVGVIMQTPEISQLSDKLGISFTTFKSGENKAIPSFYEEPDSEQKKVLQQSIDDAFGFFLELVTKNRKLTNENLEIIKDGRIFTGRQAVKIGLVDQIGNKDDAMNWLIDEKYIDEKLSVKEVSLEKKETLAEKLNIISKFPEIMSNFLFKQNNILR